MKRMGKVIVGVVLVIGCIFLFNQKNTKEILITEEQELDNTSLVFMLQDEEGNYNNSDALPSTGYTFNASKSVCSNNATPTWEDNRLYLNNLTKNGTSCYLYFDKKPMAMNTILADKEIRTRNDFSVTVEETTTGVIYESLDETQYDNDGKVYYFAGNPTDNWVQFAGFYWRIIRINEDGSIRMIYAGTSYETSGTDDQIQTSAYNTNYNDNAYVGYMYGTPGSDTYEETHANINDSTIKTILDKWYQNNLLSYSEYISTDASFCSDRGVASEDETWWPEDTKLGYGTNYTFYATYNRLVRNRMPIFKCNSIEDLHTVINSRKGNKALNYPIGLITADEAMYAGGGGGGIVNQSYYLYTGEHFWTISPYYFPEYGYAVMFTVYLTGYIGFTRVDNSTLGVRPVINLDASVTLSGSGTSTDPYVVEGAM